MERYLFITEQEAYDSIHPSLHRQSKLSVPKTVPVNELRDVLEALADELMVDITLDEA